MVSRASRYKANTQKPTVFIYAGWGRYRFAVVSVQNTYFILALLLILHTNICRPFVLPCSTCQQLEIEILKRLSFTIAPKIMKYFDINLTKYVHYLYATNNKTLVTKITDVNKKRERFHSLASEDSVSLGGELSPGQRRFDAVPTKMPACFL